MTTAWLSAMALVPLGLLWLLHARAVPGATRTGGHPRGSQLVATVLLYAGTWALIAYLVQ